jgi:hypothetical protein
MTIVLNPPPILPLSPASAPLSNNAVAAFDARPFFDKALHYGVKQGVITPARLLLIQEDFAKGIVQIAHFFGTAHLRPELELALRRMANLISLYLEDMSDGDLQLAAISLRDKTFLSHSKGGSEMLKRLQTLPDSTLIDRSSTLPEQQRAYLDEKTAAATISLADYRAELAQRQDNRNTIDCAFWLARKMGVARDDLSDGDDADALMRSAMLLIFIDQAEFKPLTRTTFVRLIKAAKRPQATLDERRLNAVLKDAPTEFQQITRRAMARFVANDLPQIRAAGNSADKLLYGEVGQAYFVSESLDEDVREYDRLVAREWDRVTHGEADDPAVLATVFLFLATGLPPKATMLLKEAKEITRLFRADGFNAKAVIDFIDNHAPESTREDLRKTWADDLKPEAEEQLADTDPNWPDTHMARALEYLRKTCCATWKSRQR